MLGHAMSRIEEKRILRAKMGEPGELAAKKTLTRIDKYARTYIERSPFLCIGTADEHGNADVSPRGDPPGFVRVVDDKTIIIPDRPGNNRVDTMSNIIANPQVGILFIIPGIDSAAPDRTETKSGSAGSPNFFPPNAVSTFFTASSICGIAASGSFLPFS